MVTVVDVSDAAPKRGLLRSDANYVSVSGCRIVTTAGRFAVDDSANLRFFQFLMSSRSLAAGVNMGGSRWYRDA